MFRLVLLNLLISLVRSHTDTDYGESSSSENFISEYLKRFNYSDLEFGKYSPPKSNSPCQTYKTCGPNEVFTRCGPICVEDSCAQRLCIPYCEEQCVTGCFCKCGFYREITNGECVPEEKCNFFNNSEYLNVCPEGKLCL